MEYTKLVHRSRLTDEHLGSILKIPIKLFIISKLNTIPGFMLGGKNWLFFVIHHRIIILIIIIIELFGIYINKVFIS